MKFRALATTAVAAALVLVGAGDGGAAQFQGVVATIAGEEEVTAQEVREELQQTALKHETMGLSPRQAVELGFERRLRMRLVLFDVKKRKLLDGDLGDRTKSNEIRALVQVFRQAYPPQIAVTEREIDQAMPARSLERIRLRYIVSTSKEVMRDVLSRVRAGGNFEALADEFTEGPTSGRGGDIGWAERDENRYFTEEHWSSIQKLPAGGVSEMFPSRLFEGAWTIARVDEIKPYAPEEIAAIRAEQRAILQQKKYDAEMTKLMRDSGLTVKEDVLRRIATAERGETLASYSGGVVTAGMFRRDLERGGVDVAALDEKTARAYLQSFCELAVVAGAARKAPVMTGNPGIMAGIKRGTEGTLFSFYFDLLYEKITISDKEVERYYREHPEENEIPEQVDLWQIHVASEGEAKEALARLRKGEELETLAVFFAWNEQERTAAGRVGLTQRSGLPAPVADIVFSLGLMQPSKPIATRFGYYIYQVRRKISAVKLTLEERAEPLRAQLLEDKKAAVFYDQIEKLKKNYPVKVNDAALDKI